MDQNERDDKDAPKAYYCPISHQIMQDPYIDSDGNSYEKIAIFQWLESKSISPITRRPMNASDLVPNRSLKALIDEYVNGTISEPPPPQPAPATVLNRKPILLFGVIDNSGSMGETCGGSTNGEEDGFSRLDLVIHTLNTIVSALCEQDKICLIKFSDTAEIVVNITALTTINKAVVLSKVKDLKPENSTNIWDGLRVALDIIAAQPEEVGKEYNTEVFLLTDGVPNINPPRPLPETLKNYLEKKSRYIQPRISTFGYGYSLLSDLLYEISVVGRGCFGFIPDATMVGTVFINSLSGSLVGTDPQLLEETLLNEVRIKFCETLRNILKAGQQNKESILQSFVEFLTEKRTYIAEHVDEGTSRASEFVEALLLDCSTTEDANSGQIEKAINGAFFVKWGKHYLYSVLSAFENNLCINFKDKAMQLFKFDRFAVEQERLEDLFISLPAPKPSLRQDNRRSYYNRGGSTGSPSSYASPPPAPQMATYHTAMGGCFTAESKCIVRASDGTISVSCADKIERGMQVLTKMGWSAVECAVKLRYKGPIYQVDNLYLTPYHPVEVDGKNYFPITCPGSKIHSSGFDGFVYDFVLVDRGVIASPAEGCIVFAATFGHGVYDVDQVFQHEYFGSEAVVNDLKRHPQWASGFIELSDYGYVRDVSNDSRVIGMHFEVIPSQLEAEA